MVWWGASSDHACHPAPTAGEAGAAGWLSCVVAEPTGPEPPRRSEEGPEIQDTPHPRRRNATWTLKKMRNKKKHKTKSKKNAKKNCTKTTNLVKIEDGKQQKKNAFASPPAHPCRSHVRTTSYDVVMFIPSQKVGRTSRVNLSPSQKQATCLALKLAQSSSFFFCSFPTLPLLAWDEDIVIAFLELLLNGPEIG